MTPRLLAFRKENPGIAIEFQCSIEPASALKMETDLSICFQSPEEQDLIAIKLGTLHFVPWASPRYLKNNGTPNTPKELMKHDLLNHFSYDRDAKAGEWDPWFALARAANLIGYRTNSSPSLLSAIQSGLGIGMLPTYACECVDGIVPLMLDLRTSSEFWLTYHHDLRDSARFRAVIDWVKALYDTKVWPWFRDEFHEPETPPAIFRAQATLALRSLPQDEMKANGQEADLSDRPARAKP
jgi:DNA-binding transcriptional LysR family regulator